LENGKKKTFSNYNIKSQYPLYVCFLIQKMSDIVGKDLQPDSSSSLQDMIDLGLNKFIEK
jgi:hypothetical protein